MQEKQCKKFSLKINVSFENINSKLKKLGCALKESYYILDIYMANKNYLKNNVQSINGIPDYLIIRDYNNEKREILLFNDGVFKGDIKGVFSTKVILEKLEYEELFNINKEVFVYSKDELYFKIVNVRNLGFFLEYDKDSDIIKITKILDDLKINYDKNIIRNDYADLAFNKYIKGKNL